VCLTPTSLRRFCDVTDKPKPTGFWDPNQETVKVILRVKSLNRSCRFWGPNRKTIDLDFETQPRNPHSSSPCAQYRSHTASPDLPIIQPPSARPVLTISGPLHQVFYSCLDPHWCPPCCTCYLHTTRQVNIIFQMKQNKGKTTEISRIWIRTSTCQWLITIKSSNWSLDFLYCFEQELSALAWFVCQHSESFSCCIYIKKKNRPEKEQVRSKIVISD
jgi:hypothetical protein